MGSLCPRGEAPRHRRAMGFRGARAGAFSRVAAPSRGRAPRFFRVRCDSPRDITSHARGRVSRLLPRIGGAPWWATRELPPRRAIPGIWPRALARPSLNRCRRGGTRRRLLRTATRRLPGAPGCPPGPRAHSHVACRYRTVRVGSPARRRLRACAKAPPVDSPPRPGPPALPASPALHRGRPRGREGGPLLPWRRADRPRAPPAPDAASSRRGRRPRASPPSAPRRRPSRPRCGAPPQPRPPRGGADATHSPIRERAGHQRRL